MSKNQNKQTLSESVAHLPEHGPIVDGREVLLSLKNVDITFGKGDMLCGLLRTLLLTSTRAKPSPW